MCIEADADLIWYVPYILLIFTIRQWKIFFSPLSLYCSFCSCYGSSQGSGHVTLTSERQEETVGSPSNPSNVLLAHEKTSPDGENISIWSSVYKYRQSERAYPHILRHTDTRWLIVHRGYMYVICVDLVGEFWWMLGKRRVDLCNSTPDFVRGENRKSMVKIFFSVRELVDRTWWGGVASTRTRRRGLYERKWW